MSIYVDVAISLMMVFLVLSLVVTAVNELISIQLHKRPKMLLQTIVRLIDNDELRTRFYANGFIAGGKEASKAGVNVPQTAAGNLTAATKPGGTFPDPAQSERDYAAGHASYIASANFARAISMSLEAMDRSNANSPFNKVKSAIGTLPDSRIKDVLGKAVDASGTSVATFEAEVAAWFDSTQERVTGAYARYQKYLALAVAAVIVLAFNADAVRLTRELQVNQAMRAQLVTVAEGVVAKGVESCDAAEDREACLVEQIRTQFAGLSPVPFGWAGDPFYESLGSLPLFGAAEAAEPAPMAAPGSLLYGGASKVFGLLITILAASIGAPFWFDMLSKFVNIRGAGVKPEAKPA
jgi:hypothetical protein